MLFILKNLLKKIFSRKRGYFLIAFQNNNELRSTGGYITQVLEIRAGCFSLSLKFLDVNTDLIHSRVEKPPAEMEKYLKVATVQFRDANYDPEFEISARRMVRLYNCTFPDQEVTGIAAVNFSVLEDLLGVLGPIKIRGEGCLRTWTRDKLFYMISTEVSDIDFHDPDERNARKAVLKRLFKSAVKTCVLRFWRWAALRRLFRDVIKARAAQVFFCDAEVQAKWRKKGLYVNFSPGSARDYLAVIDNNYLGVKSNRYIRRLISHDVLFSYDNKKSLPPVIRATIELDHLGERNYPLSHTYQSWISVYLPLYAEVEIVNVDGTATTFQCSEHCSFKVFGLHVLLKPRSRKTIEVKYSLPANLFKDNIYSFKYLKQSGVENEILMNTVKFPDQFMIESAKHSARDEMITNENLLTTVHTSCCGDFQFEVKSLPHGEPPRIFYHEIIGPQTIEIRFNEPVTLDADIGCSISMRDRHTKTAVHIDKIEFIDENRTLLIRTNDLPDNEGAFYHLELKNIRNLAGDTFKNNSRKLTVVYRPKQFRA